MNSHRLAIAAALLSTTVCSATGFADDGPLGQDDLDRAAEIHFDANSLRDFERVVSLCDSALEKGLDEPGTLFANELVGSTLFRRATAIFGGMRRGGIGTDELLRLRELALADLDKAVKHKPNLAGGFLLMCELSSLPGGDRKRGHDAAASAAKVLEKDGVDKKRLSLAYLWRAKFGDDLEKQLADFRLASELEPNNPVILKQHAEFLHEKEQFADAVKTIRKLIEAAPDESGLKLALVESLSKMGDDGVAEAFAELDKILESDPKLTAAYRMRAQLHIQQDDQEKAIADLSKAIQIDRSDIGSRLFRAEIYLFTNELDKAREDVTRALSRNPGLIYGIQLRSRISAAEGDIEEAMNDIRLLIENDGDNPEHRLQLAAYLNADKRPRAAIKEIGKVLEADAGNWRALRARADAYLSVGKHAEAVADYERALKIRPDDSGILNNFAWVLATSMDDAVRDGERAIKMATKACELTKFEAAHILSTLASGYAETGDFETAIKWSTKSVELGEGEMAEQLKGELKSYQEKKPWRENQVIEEKEVAGEKKNLIDT
jgi:tetratricopeptide (TPR) repeat protein